MKIRFEITIDDIVAFNRFHFQNSPAFRRQVWTQMLMVPVIIAGLYFLIYLNRDPFDDMGEFPWIFAMAWVVISLAWAVGIRWQIYQSLGKNTRKFLAEGSNRIILGWREMELTNRRLIIRTELTDSSFDLRAVEKIVHNEDYTFVYIASIQAYIIPMNLYPEDEYRAFAAELREAWENRDAPTPTDKPLSGDVRITERKV